jgi:predicted outer membrane repeat protein
MRAMSAALLGLFLSCSFQLPAGATTWLIRPDGSGDAPTIQAGIDSASVGDTVLVACGTYHEHDIVLKSLVYLMSATGYADCATIDAQDNGSVIRSDNLESAVGLSGFTITGAATSGMYWRGCFAPVMFCHFVGNSGIRGGAVRVEGNLGPTFYDCTFHENDASGDGGALYTEQGYLGLYGCTFHDNFSGAYGGAVACQSGELDLRMEECTLALNAADQGGAGISCPDATGLDLRNSIIAFGTGGEAVHCASGSGSPVVQCCDLFGNSGGDWTGPLEALLGQNGNMSADPMFCDPASGDFTLQECSPCGPLSSPHPECGLIGAWPIGCGGTPITRISWGGLKVVFVR